VTYPGPTFPVTGIVVDAEGNPPRSGGFIRFTPISQMASPYTGYTQLGKHLDVPIGPGNGIIGWPNNGVSLVDNGIGYKFEVHVHDSPVVKGEIPCGALDWSNVIVPLPAIEFDAVNGIVPSVQIDASIDTVTIQVAYLGRRLEVTRDTTFILPRFASVPVPDDSLVFATPFNGATITAQGEDGLQRIYAPYGLVLGPGSPVADTNGADITFRKRRQSFDPDGWTVQL
jgi:hypothetical protein